MIKNKKFFSKLSIKTDKYDQIDEIYSSVLELNQKIFQNVDVNDDTFVSNIISISEKAAKDENWKLASAVTKLYEFLSLSEYNIQIFRDFFSIVEANIIIDKAYENFNDVTSFTISAILAKTLNRFNVNREDITNALDFSEVKCIVLFEKNIDLAISICKKIRSKTLSSVYLCFPKSKYEYSIDILDMAEIFTQSNSDNIVSFGRSVLELLPNLNTKYISLFDENVLISDDYFDKIYYNFSGNYPVIINNSNNIFAGNVLNLEFLSLEKNLSKPIAKYSDIKEIFEEIISKHEQIAYVSSGLTPAVNSDISTDYKFLVSVIIPIYKVENYLKEAIDSVVSQTIGFEKKVQLILVNDGSTDDCGDICKKYTLQYPQNVLYFEQENKGVSSARNLGLKHAKGELVAFLDGDDYLDYNYLKTAVEFLHKNEEAGFVAFPLNLFGNVRQNQNHPLNWKFSATRVVDTAIEPEYIQLHCASTVIRRSAIGSLQFNTDFKYGEDIDFMHRIIANCGKYGVAKESRLNYRKREDGAVANSNNNVDWYNKFEKLSDSLVCDDIFLPKYTQYCLLYDLQWYDFESIPEELQSEINLDQLRKTVKRIIKLLDDDVILSKVVAKHLTVAQRNYLIELKYGKYDYQFIDKNHVLRYKSNFTKAVDFFVDINAQFNVIEEYDNIIKFVGSFDAPDYENFAVKIKISNDFFEAKNLVNHSKYEYFLAEKIHEKQYFEFDIPAKIALNETISFYVEVRGIGLFPLTVLFANNCRMREYDGSFVLGENVIITFAKNTFKVYPITVNFLNESLLKYGENFKQFDNEKAILKNYINIYSSYSKRKIWIFSDRAEKADDNAEFLFKYSSEIVDGIEKYFAVSDSQTTKKNSNKIPFLDDIEEIYSEEADFGRLSEYGNVVDYGSEQHKLLFLFAKKLITSEFDFNSIFPTKSLRDLYAPLIRGKIICLQHGVTKDDMTKIVNKWSHNFKMLVCAGTPEYNAFLESKNYGFDENIVKLTGFPRFDEISESSEPVQKTILFMPTWRRILAILDIQSNSWMYNKQFKNTNYFKSIQTFFDNKALGDLLTKNGYTIKFAVHPNMRTQIRDFELPKYVTIADKNTSYHELFQISKIAVTDYSSTAFDFAYLEKPVIYYQFDKQPLEKGYFDYEHDGFGEVCFDLTELVKTIENYIKNDGIMLGKYKERVKSFFPYHDNKNSERAYKAIVEIDSKKIITDSKTAITTDGKTVFETNIQKVSSEVTE
ncbi:hypothetical protein FACS1894132_01190 [Clostridia bacterium]|nr:hypothetical protein FACS1894132_01190 [Clostridia bacterium]